MQQTLIKAASFWDGTHPLSELQEQLHEKLIPGRGEAANAHGELLRAMTNLYYDVYNNGYCNHEVLAEQRDFVNRYKPELVPLLANADSWRKGLHTLLKAAGDAAGDDDMPAEADCLEDIVTAVIKYVAAKEGIALPSA